MEIEKKQGNERRLVGKVNPDERDEIQRLFNRKNGLIELSRTLTSASKKELENSPLYEKLTEDLGKTTNKFNDWWKRMSEKYKWENAQDYRWEIDFSTCQIYIFRAECKDNECYK